VTRSVENERTSRGETIKGRRFQWLVKTADSTCASRLAGALNLPPLMARLLTARGITAPTQARSFLARRLGDLPDPHQLPDVEGAVVRIAQALEADEIMVVFGDYDVDGVTATALLYHFLSSLGGKVRWYLPHRLREGYGLNPGAIGELSRQGVRLIISVDCGSSDHEAILLARSLGMEVIVTDHHHPPEVPPEAAALVNPRRLPEGEDLRHLAGVGVAFYVVTALRAYLRRAGRWEKAAEPNLRRYLDWVALGTLADVAPLTQTNRILSAAGLRVLSEATSPGMRALKEVCGLTESKVSGWDVLFRLGPRLNAAGRLESADLAIRLLLSEDAEEARTLAVKLDEINRQRQDLEERTVAQALAQVQADDPMQHRKALVLAEPAWHRGLLGLAAARLVERFNKPTILLTRGDHGWEGSGRSPAGIDLYRTLSSCRAHLRRFGGHQLAAGLSLGVEQLASFCGALEEALSQVDAGLPQPREADARVHLGEITPSLISYLELMGPFGEGNPEPVFCCEGFQVESLQVLKGRHLKLRLSQGDVRLTAIGFNLARSGEAPLAPRRIFASPTWNSWQGERRLELQIHDYEGEGLSPEPRTG
jgi:single-stranded-DNA-specific exonuclease